MRFAGASGYSMPEGGRFHCSACEAALKHLSCPSFHAALRQRPRQLGSSQNEGRSRFADGLACFSVQIGRQDSNPSVTTRQISWPDGTLDAGRKATNCRGTVAAFEHLELRRTDGRPCHDDKQESSALAKACSCCVRLTAPPGNTTPCYAMMR